MCGVNEKLLAMVFLIPIAACLSTSPAGCSTFGNGIFTHGLSPAMVEYLNQIETSINNVAVVLSQVELYIICTIKIVKCNIHVYTGFVILYSFYKQNLFSFASINATMQSTSMVYMRTSDRLYMGPAVFQAITLYALEAQTLLDSVSSVRTISLGLFIGVSVILYVFFYHPMIWLLNDDTKRIWYLSRALLFLLTFGNAIIF